MISRCSFGSLYPKTNTRKPQKFYKYTMILKFVNIASTTFEMLVNWLQPHNDSAIFTLHLYFWSSRLIKLSSLLFTSIGTLENFKVLLKFNNQMNWNSINLKIKLFLWFSDFPFEPYTQTRKLGNKGKFTKRR